MKIVNRARVLLLFCVLAALPLPGTQEAIAQAVYPTGPVRIVVPFQAGGLTDILGRAIAQQLSERMGQQFVVENRAGAGGNIGADAVAKAKPDGQTLLMGSIGTNAVNAHLYSKMPFDTLKDFVPISLVASGTLMLVVNSTVPAQNMKELIALAKANPGKLTYASGGAGASQHLAGELLKSMAGIDIVHVPYKGVAQGVTDLVAGQVSMTFDLATVLPHIKSGKLRPIAVANGARTTAFPEIPTIAEAGVPGYEASAWYGLFAPAGTSRDIVNRLNTEVVRALQLPEIRQRLLALGAEPVGNSPDQFSVFIRMEYEKWGRVAKSAKITLD